MGEKVVISGASGHIGHHVARKLLARGHQVHLLVRDPGAPLVRALVRDGAYPHPAVDHLSAAPGADGEAARALTCLEGAAALFHLAATNTTSAAAPAEVIRSTVGLTGAVLSAAKRAGVPTVVYTSSVVVLGRSPDPARPRTEADVAESAESPYVQGKIEAEGLARAARDEGRDVRIVYPSWVLGPGDPRMTPPHRLVLDYVRKGQRFYFEGGISIAHVEEVAAGHVAAWESGVPGGRYLLGGENVTFQNFYGLLARAAGRAAPFLRLPTRALHLAGDVAKGVFSAIGRQPPVSPEYLRAVVGRYSWYDSGRAQRELAYRIRPAAETLTEAVALARQRLGGTHHLNLALRGAPGEVTSPLSAVVRTGSRPDPAGPGAVAAAVEAGPVEAGPVEAGPVFPSPGRLLITGVPGWLGSRLVDVLVNGDRFGHRYPARPVRLLVHPSARGSLEELPAGFEVHPGDLNDPLAVRAAVADVSTVIHLAGVIYPPRVRTFYHVNAAGTRTLVDACIAAGVRRFLFMSTDSVCGHGTPAQRVFDEHTMPSPYRHYGRSKWQAEEYILEKTREGKLDGTSLRGFWFFGPYAPPRQLGFTRMFASWPRQVVFGDGKNLRSISHVDNIVQALLAAENSAVTHGKWYWVGDAEGGHTVDEIYGAIARAFGRPYRPLYVPGWFCTGVLGALDRVLTDGFGRIQPTVHAAAKFPFDIAGRSDAAVRDFGYAPRVTLPDAALESAEAVQRG